MNTVEPEFEELRDVVLSKARCLERRDLFISRQMAGLGYATLAEPTLTASTTTSSAPMMMTSPTSTASDLKSLSEQIARLTLLAVMSSTHTCAAFEICQTCVAPRRVQRYKHETRSVKSSRYRVRIYETR